MSETISVHNMFSPGLSLQFSRIELVIQWTICRHIHNRRNRSYLFQVVLKVKCFKYRQIFVRSSYFASNNPQCDDRLFIELQVQYMKISSSNLGRTCCVQKFYLTFRTIFVHNMFSTCSELAIFMYWTSKVIQWTICGHIVG